MIASSPAEADDGREAWNAALEACRAADLAHEKAAEALLAIEVDPPLPEALRYRWRSGVTGEECVDEFSAQYFIDRRLPAGPHWSAGPRANAMAALTAWQAARDAAREAAGYFAAEEASSKAGNASCDAFSRLIQTPAPDNAALAEKLARIVDRDAFEDGVLAMVENLQRHGRA